jgi:hypothetical protein
MIYTRTTNLGALPLIIGAGAAIEAAWAWYDPDVFFDVWLEADQEQQVASLNNWWAALESTSWRTLDPKSRVAKKLGGTVSAWAKWLAQYHGAILRRWLPGGRDWEAELQVWFERFREESEAVARAGGEAAERALEEKGIDPRSIPEKELSLIEEAQEAASSVIEKASGAAGDAGKTVGSGFLWPAIALGASAGLLIWLATSTSKRRPMRA